MMSVTPQNTLAGRRLSQAAIALPVVTVVIKVGSPDPQSLLANVTTQLPQGGPFDTDVLPRYQLEMTSAPQVTPFKNFAAYDPNAPPSSTTPAGASTTTTPAAKPTSTATASTSSSGGLSVGAIVGIAVGGVVALALIGVLVWVFVARRKKTQLADSPMGTSTSSDGKFYSEKSALHDDVDSQSV